MARSLLLLCVLCFATSPLRAEATLTGANFGTYISGPKVGAADLAGKVVLFEYWGVHCPPCLASIPHLAEMQKKYGRDNFVIIANHCQGEPAEMVVSTWSGKGGGQEISVVADGSLPNANVSGIPRCFLFDHEGKLVFDGRPSDVEEKVAQAMKESPGALIAGGTFKKQGKNASALAAMKGNWTPILKTLRTAAAGTDADAKSEAEFLIERATGYADGQMARIKDDRSEDPAAAMTALNRMAALLKGDEIGKPFEDLQKEYKADKSLQSELSAAAALAAICSEADKIGLGADRDAAKQRKQAAANIAGGLQAVQKKFPDTAACRKAAKLQAAWGL
jgi:thiol-disulfide isomerase/thioredoxin